LKKVFFDSISKGQADSVEALAASFSLNSVVYNGDTPATAATRNGNIQTMQVLLEEGASFSKKNKKGETPLSIAIKMKDVEKVRFLIENQVTIGSTALFDAISYADDEQRVREALDKKKRLSTKPDYYFIMVERCEIIKLLIEHGANVNAKNEVGDTLMCLIARCGNFALDKFTKENGKWINLVEYLAPKMNNYLESNKNGQTPLDIARSQGNTRMLKGFDVIPHTKRFH
jgi:ankyrin repeat protein